MADSRSYRLLQFALLVGHERGCQRQHHQHLSAQVFTQHGVAFLREAVDRPPPAWRDQIEQAVHQFFPIVQHEKQGHGHQHHIAQHRQHRAATNLERSERRRHPVFAVVAEPTHELGLEVGQIQGQRHAQLRQQWLQKTVDPIQQARQLLAA